MSFDVRTRLSKLKSSAKARNLKLDLDVNKYQNLIDCGCHFCGADLSRENGYCLDRIDSNKGYVFTNVIPCCKICNRAKSNMDIMDFVNWLKQANTFTQAAIESVKNEVYSLELELKAHEELNKNKPKERITL